MLNQTLRQVLEDLTPYALDFFWTKLTGIRFST